MNDSLIDKYLPADYSDSFEKKIRGGKSITPDDFMDIAFNRSPRWIKELMKLRNKLVKPLGLDTARRLEDMVCARNQNEIIFGMPDKHLTFYASLWCGVRDGDLQKLRITTVVTYHNRMGRIYFFFIRPFHKIILRSIVNRVGKK